METQEKLTTYVHDGKEVYLTGRIALPQSDAPRTANIQKMVEIVPLGTVLNDLTYAKWVKVTELLVIHNLEEEDFDDETE